MKRYVLLAFSVGCYIISQGQTWSKISSNYDSLWTSSVKYFNKGDTIIYYGSVTGTGAFDAKRFYVSTDGGYNFNRDYTNLDAISLFPIVGLPINNMIIGFKNTPDLGSYSFQALGNWTSILPTGTGIYGEVDNGTLLWNPGSGSTQIRTLTPTGGSLTLVASGSTGIDLISSFNKGNRLFLGGGTANIKYVDSGNFAGILSSTINPAISGSAYDVVRFFESGSSLYAVINNGFDRLYQSTDNGVTWNLQTTTYTDGSTTFTLNSSFIIGTPNGNIFFLETSTGTSDNVYLSTDGGLTATKIPNGLPTNGLLISPTIGKLLTNGNKVWYQVCKANSTDFVRTDTTIAGLYLLDMSSTNVQESKTENDLIVLFPNPTKNRLTINATQPIVSYEIVNVMGQVVLADRYNGQPIDLSNIQSGIYFARLKTNQNKLFTKKIIIEK